MLKLHNGRDYLTQDFHTRGQINPSHAKPTGEGWTEGKSQEDPFAEFSPHCPLYPMKGERERESPLSKTIRIPWDPCGSHDLAMEPQISCRCCIVVWPHCG
ncbi:BPI fold-containing family C protein [Platysternon megacephalum]|uniref:BPI fold-containing family C protein n=1 Tax=Platysternon megacephalum TaxID=55544 RepID=A0A4D9EDY8_9SAUR|nr:BPI fold-containing family C protein [Platysternon megacephalum]